MFGELTTPQIEALLEREVVGRLGCSNGNRPYIVPISYHYDGEYIYCHTREGLKIDIMRKNPLVCFEVDHLTDMANWETVIVHGYFEELTDPEARRRALDKLYHRVLPLVSSETTHLSPDWPFAPAELNGITGVTFRIRVNERTGRFERSCANAYAF